VNESKPVNESPPTSKFVRFRVCAWCGRFMLGGEWIAAEDAMRQLDMDPGAPPSVTHGICPECLAANPPPPKRGKSAGSAVRPAES
jgi:hypothetical protein